MFVMKWYVLVTYGTAEGSLGTPFLSSVERVSVRTERRTNVMAVQTATYGRSASHSRAKVEVAIFQRCQFGQLLAWELDAAVNREEGIARTAAGTSKCAPRRREACHATRNGED